jgi:hypothetical protein
MGPRSPESVHPLKRNRRRRISIPNGVYRKLDEKSAVLETEDTEETLNEKHAMAPIVPVMSKEEVDTHDQSQSLLFQKLPPEVRSLIWRECVGNYNIYLGIVDGEKRIRHCKIFEGLGLMGKIANQEEQDELMRKHYFVSMLQSCRRM